MATKEIIKKFLWRNKESLSYQFSVKCKVALGPTQGDAFKVTERRELTTTLHIPFWSPDEKILFWGHKEKAEAFYRDVKHITYLNGRVWLDESL